MLKKIRKRITYWQTEMPIRTAAVALAGFGIISALALWIAAVESPDDTLTVAFLDVGQGDAIYIEAPNGRQLLIDGGPSRKVLRELSEVMPFWDRSIDVLLATHPDKDHIGGLVDVLASYNVGAVLRSGAVNDTGLFDHWRERVASTEVFETELRTGHTIWLSPRVHLDVLFPSRAARPKDLDPNEASVAVRVVYEDTAFLLSGDTPKAIEEYLAGVYRDNLRSQVLKLGHHGSDTSTAELWLGWTGPEYAVVSAGKDNRHGHPDPSVIDRVKRFDIPVLNTATHGTIVFESNGEEVTLRGDEK